jgi:shikimate dehydrogenase
MKGPDQDELAFSEAAIEASAYVLDAVAFPWETPMIKTSQRMNKPVITGAEIIAGQAALQFALYTGITPTPDQVARAAEFSRA